MLLRSARATGCPLATANGVWPVQGRVGPCRVVVGLEVGEFPLQIPRIPEEHLVQKFSPYRADQALYKGV